MRDGSDVFEALEAEQDQLSDLLGSLTEREWSRRSACAGWSVCDVVLHLAQTEETVVVTVTGGGFDVPGAASGATIDELMDEWVAAQRGGLPDEVLERWRVASRAAVAALREADPDAQVAWAATPLKPRTLATTRLSEHWIHAQDIAEPLDREYPDTDRLWNIVWLAHRTVPFAYARAERADPPTVYLELESPAGDRWTFGSSDAEVAISGKASALCRVAGRRLSPEASGLDSRGERAGELLSLIRTYA